MPRHFRCRSPLAQATNSEPSILDNCNVKHMLKCEFENLQCRSPPVIWIFGYSQKTIEKIRLSFTGRLAKKLGFIYINPERILTILAIRYLNYCPCKSSRAWYWSKDANRKCGEFLSTIKELPKILLECPHSIQRIVFLLKNIITHHPTEAFNTRGVMEIIKMLFMTFPRAKGYIVDGFPGKNSCTLNC